jgi:hypothetical protein
MTYHKAILRNIATITSVRCVPYPPCGRRPKRASSGLRITPTLEVDVLQAPLIGEVIDVMQDEGDESRYPDHVLATDKLRRSKPNRETFTSLPRNPVTVVLEIVVACCDSAPQFDPRSASNRDPGRPRIS